MKRVLSLFLAAFACAVAIAACSSHAGDDSHCQNEPVEPLKELIIVDEGVIDDARAKNATDGPWSFRSVVENLAPTGADPGDWVLSWLKNWVEAKDINGYPLDEPGEERVAGLYRFILCPWLSRTPTNGCVDRTSSSPLEPTCTCTSEKLDLAFAPFRLSAIANRLDARDERPDLPLGDGRLTFALTDGPADDPASQPLAMSIVFEFGLPATKSLGEWARTWHELGSMPAFDETYKAKLQAITDSFSRRGANPQGINQSALLDVRTNERIMDWIWQLRQFQLSSDGSLLLSPTRNTPPQELNNSTRVADWVKANASDVLAQKYEMPLSMRGGSAEALRFSWTLPDVDEPTLRAFRRGTCNGCHTERPNVDSAFHISPFRTGPDRLSQFILDPVDGELGHRQQTYREALCSP